MDTRFLHNVVLYVNKSHGQYTVEVILQFFYFLFLFLRTYENKIDLLSVCGCTERERDRAAYAVYRPD